MAIGSSANANPFSGFGGVPGKHLPRGLDGCEVEGEALHLLYHQRRSRPGLAVHDARHADDHTIAQHLDGPDGPNSPDPDPESPPPEDRWDVVKKFMEDHFYFEANGERSQAVAQEMARQSAPMTANRFTNLPLEQFVDIWGNVTGAGLYDFLHCGPYGNVSSCSVYICCRLFKVIEIFAKPASHPAYQALESLGPLGRHLCSSSFAGLADVKSCIGSDGSQRSSRVARTPNDLRHRELRRRVNKDQTSLGV